MAGDPGRAVPTPRRAQPQDADRPWWHGREGMSVAKIAAAGAVVGAVVGLVTSVGVAEGLVITVGAVLGLVFGALVALAVNLWHATR